MKYLICNLKAHKNYLDMVIYRDAIREFNYHNLELIIAPQNVYLSLFSQDNISLCTQNLDLYQDKCLTGNTSLKALKSLNVKYVLIGHYERRKYYQETEIEIINKINSALQNNLKVIYCIGETKEELMRHVDLQVLEKSLARILNNIPKNYFDNLIIAYEPTYLIGNNLPHNFTKIIENIAFIKDIINNYYHANIKVVYGGNITPENINNFLKIPNLDGFIIGNACLNPANLEKIIYNMTNE